MTTTTLTDIEQSVLLAIYAEYLELEQSFQQRPMGTYERTFRDSLRCQYRDSDCVPIAVRQWFDLKQYNGNIAQRVTRALNRLEELGFVQRIYSMDAVRARHVRLLPTGRQQAEAIVTESAVES